MNISSEKGPASRVVDIQRDGSVRGRVDERGIQNVDIYTKNRRLNALSAQEPEKKFNYWHCPKTDWQRANTSALSPV